jgi:shikimate kinase
VIVLVGFMGAGKTTVGRALANRLDRRFVDADRTIERDQGVSIPAIFEGYGETGFREIEARVIADLLRGPEVVLALGGGAVTTPAVRESLAGHRVVLLDIGYEDALARVAGDAGRPMLARPDLAEEYQRRLPLYAEVATLVVPVAGRSTADVVESIVAGLRLPSPTAARPVDAADPEPPE